MALFYNYKKIISEILIGIILAFITFGAGWFARGCDYEGVTEETRTGFQIDKEKRLNDSLEKHNIDSLNAAGLGRFMDSSAGNSKH